MSKATPIESVLLASSRVSTYDQQRLLTNASGFFFERDERLFFVTSRHVVIDEPSKHFPDRLEIELHIDPANLGASVWFSMPLYIDGKSAWRQGADTGGEIDVAVLELSRKALPATMPLHAFTPKHLPAPRDNIGIGSSLLVIGFPLGFHDMLHHLPVARQAVVASAYGLRFQGKGFFLTDARTHRGTSGAPVVMKAHHGRTANGTLPWVLLGIHSSRFDIDERDAKIDEALGLNCAWYADILMTLTEH
jgi:Trypsin-like peptidase domain